MATAANILDLSSAVQAMPWVALATGSGCCALCGAAVSAGLHPCTYLQAQQPVAGAGVCGVHGLGQCTEGNRAARTRLQGGSGSCQGVRGGCSKQSVSIRLFLVS